tara:strand:+ start:8060 stop:8272 length:213 start_codon:yes stop_codon:yes gene_type:complete
MPTKLKKSSQTYNRATGKTTTEHYYIKNQSLDTLFEELNRDNTKPKVKQKIRNEINRRGVKIVKRPIESE